MIEAADRILAYTAGMTKEAFDTASMAQDAVIRNIEIIGEAASNLLRAEPQIAAKYPEIPFAEIYGMRNRVSHGYFAVSLEMVWETILTDIPQLRMQIGKILEDMPNEN